MIHSSEALPMRKMIHLPQTKELNSHHSGIPFFRAAFSVNVTVDSFQRQQQSIRLPIGHYLLLESKTKQYADADRLRETTRIIEYGQGPVGGNL